MSQPYRPDHRLQELLDRFEIDEVKAKPLAILKREIAQYGKRRCDVEASRDNLVYYLGFAFEVNDGLNIDSLALAGLLSLPSATFEKLLGREYPRPTTLVELFRRVLAQPKVLEWARAQGTWLQWNRLEAIYREAVAEFENSDAFGRSSWRRRPITRPQQYLIGEITRILNIEKPDLSSRGQAYDFIAENGGNPRFREAPPQPEDLW